MAQERKHFLINPHTSSADSMPTDLHLGEIAVRHANETPELIETVKKQAKKILPKVTLLGV